MTSKELALMLIQQAEDKGNADFNHWKDNYLPKKLKHRTVSEQREFLRQRYLALESWYSKHGQLPFDDSGQSRENLAWHWGLIFSDWKNGIHHLPGTPEYAEQTFELTEGVLSKPAPFIPIGWKNRLAERFKARFCMAYLDKLLNPEGKQPARQEPTTKVWVLHYWYLWKAEIMPELGNDSGKKTATLAALADKHEISRQNFKQVFNAVNRPSDKNPMKVPILEMVIPTLKDFPEAQRIAENDLKQKKEKK